MVDNSWASFTQDTLTNDIIRAEILPCKRFSHGNFYCHFIADSINEKYTILAV